VPLGTVLYEVSKYSYYRLCRRKATSSRTVPGPQSQASAGCKTTPSSSSGIVRLTLRSRNASHYRATSEWTILSSLSYSLPRLMNTMDPEAVRPSNVSFLPLGAIVQSFFVGGINIVQGFPRQDDYLTTSNPPYFGETIGRCANRISGAKIERLNNRSYELAANNGPNSLHGGNSGWGKKIWNGPLLTTRNGKTVLQYNYTSVDGEENYPGTVHCTVWYTEETQVDDVGEHVVLNIEYEAELDPSSQVEDTIVNLTNHRYC
jgi:hypothetical protein